MIDLETEHELVVARIKAYLFSDHTPDQYGIIPETEERIEPRPRGTSYNSEPLLGGVVFTLTAKNQLTKVAITHRRDDTYQIRTHTIGDWNTTYTINSIECELVDLQKTMLRAWDNAQDF